MRSRAYVERDVERDVDRIGERVAGRIIERSASAVFMDSALVPAMRVLIRTSVTMFPTLPVFLAFTVSCGSDSSSPTPPVALNRTYDISTFGENFLPASQEIAAGDTVRWTFSVAADNLGHNVLFKPRVAGAPSDIPAEVRSGTRSLKFTTKGDFNYVCDLHGAMTGIVIVK